MEDTPDNNDDKEATSETNLNSLTENNSVNIEENEENGVFQQEVTNIEHVRNKIKYKKSENENLQHVLPLLCFFRERHRGLWEQHCRLTA